MRITLFAVVFVFWSLPEPLAAQPAAPPPCTSPEHRQFDFWLTFTKRSDGSVRQFWESSQDEGKTWTVAFDGVYTKRR